MIVDFRTGDVLLSQESTDVCFAVRADGSVRDFADQVALYWPELTTRTFSLPEHEAMRVWCDPASQFRRPPASIVSAAARHGKKTFHAVACISCGAPDHGQLLEALDEIRRFRGDVVADVVTPAGGDLAPTPVVLSALARSRLRVRAWLPDGKIQA